MPPAASVPSIASDRGTGEVSTSTKEGVVLEVSLLPLFCQQRRPVRGCDCSQRTVP